MPVRTRKRKREETAVVARTVWSTPGLWQLVWSFYVSPTRTYMAHRQPLPFIYSGPKPGHRMSELNITRAVHFSRGLVVWTSAHYLPMASWYHCCWVHSNSAAYMELNQKVDIDRYCRDRGVWLREIEHEFHKRELA